MLRDRIFVRLRIIIAFRVFLTVEQTDYLIVHWFGFVFDLTIGFWMLFDKTRIPAMVFCATFNLMNSRLFSIGKFHINNSNNISNFFH